MLGRRCPAPAAAPPAGLTPWGTQGNLADAIVNVHAGGTWPFSQCQRRFVGSGDGFVPTRWRPRRSAEIWPRSCEVHPEAKGVAKSVVSGFAPVEPQRLWWCPCPGAPVAPQCRNGCRLPPIVSRYCPRSRTGVLWPTFSTMAGCHSIRGRDSGFASWLLDRLRDGPPSRLVVEFLGSCRH